MESHTKSQTTHTDGGIALPDDLILEIVSWMPTKSVCRFRSCSKFIKEFTDEAYFAKKHSKNSMLKGDSCILAQKKIHGFFQYCKTETEIHALSGDHESSCGTVPSTFLDFLDKNRVMIVASSNGLLLLQEMDDEIDVEFAFECDVDVEDYRLLAIQYRKRTSPRSEYKIYLPKEGVWKSGQGHIVPHRPCVPVFCKGAFHFLSLGNIFPKDPIILSYNLESDLVRRLNLPEEALIISGIKCFQMDIFKWGKIGSSDESICLVKLVDDTVFTIWVLTKHESSYSWSKFLIITLQEMGLIKEEEEPEIVVSKYMVVNGNSLVFATTRYVYRYDFIGERKTKAEKICDHGYLWTSFFTSYSQTLRSCGPGAISLDSF
ncbi:F-box protein interaction domain protein [Senna tora]|uniref:F-box protein interaction domain protein n=1 Tax=Senna tora TaxID=362788 RepID=A0A834W458_9FABA|nr:F-box protein interaction domain protein [Senna tora]